MNFDPRNLRARRVKTSAGVERKTIAEHAVDVLKETKNDAVDATDTALLGKIAYRAFGDGPPHGVMPRIHRVTGALRKSKLFTMRIVQAGSGHRPSRRVAEFTLKGPGDAG